MSLMMGRGTGTATRHDLPCRCKRLVPDIPQASLAQLDSGSLTRDRANTILVASGYGASTFSAEARPLRAPQIDNPVGSRGTGWAWLRSAEVRSPARVLWEQQSTAYRPIF
jgi:hypothetical protein